MVDKRGILTYLTELEKRSTLRFFYIHILLRFIMILRPFLKEVGLVGLLPAPSKGFFLEAF